MVREAYEKLQKKYDLPSFDDLNRSFEIEGFDDDEPFFLREIRRKMCEVISFYSKVLEDVLRPESGSAMHEGSQFNEKDRENVLSLYRKLKKFERMALDVGLARDEKENAAFISQVFSAWETIVKELKGISSKLITSWDVDIASEKDNGYFG